MKAKKSQKGDTEHALKSVQEIINNFVSHPTDKAWYLQEMARYTYSISKSDSNDLQISAHQKNRYLLKPRAWNEDHQAKTGGREAASKKLEMACFV